MGGIPQKLRVAADAAHKTETRWVAQTGDGAQTAWEIPAGVAFGVHDMARWVGVCGAGGGFPVRITQMQAHPERVLCYVTVWELAADADKSDGGGEPKSGWTRLVPKSGLDTGMTGANAFERLILLFAERPEVIASAGVKVAEALTPVIDTTFSPIVEVIVERTSKRTCDDVRQVVRETVREEIRALIRETFADDTDEITPDGPVAALPEPTPPEVTTRRAVLCNGCQQLFAHEAQEGEQLLPLEDVTCPRCGSTDLSPALRALPAPKQPSEPTAEEEASGPIA